MSNSNINYARGTPIRTNAYSFGDRWGSGQQNREDLGQSQQQQDNLPQLWDAVGYPSAAQLDFKTYFDRYERDGIAQALIDRPAEATWQDAPTVEDSGKASDETGNTDSETQFEKDVENFLSGETLRRSPIHRMTVAHKMAALGNYSIMVIGFDDGRPLSTPVKGVQEATVGGAMDVDVEDADATGSDRTTDQTRPEPQPQSQPQTTTETTSDTAEGQGTESTESADSGVTDAASATTEFDSLDNLRYLAVFAQDRVEIGAVNKEMTSPRFRLPETYDVRVSEDPNRQTTDGSQNVSDKTKQEEDDTKEIHWTRVIHIPQGTREDDLRGPSELKAIFNYLLNIDKILAGSAEGYWRNGFTPFHIKPPEGTGGTLQSGLTDMQGGGELASRIGRLIDNAQRTIATNAELEPVNLSVENPEPHFEMQIRAISAEKNMPQSYLMGNETGERATREDRHFWDRKVASIRNQFAAPAIFEATIDRLVAAGVIARPAGGGYATNWPELNEPSAHEKAETDKLTMQAIKLASGGNPLLLYSKAELREKLGDDPQIGAEADMPADEQAREQGMVAVDESSEAVQAAADDMGLGSGSNLSSDNDSLSQSQSQRAMTDGGGG